MSRYALGRSRPASTARAAAVPELVDTEYVVRPDGKEAAQPAFDSTIADEDHCKRQQLKTAYDEARVQDPETAEEGEPNATAAADSFVFKPIKWQLRKAKDFYRVLYIIRQPRHKADWQDASNIAAVFRKLHNLMLIAAKKEERRAAIVESVNAAAKSNSVGGGLHPASLSGYKGRPTGQRGVRVGKKGATPEERARRGGVLTEFLGMTAAEVPLLDSSSMAEVARVLRSLASVGLSEDVAPALEAIEGAQQALADRKRADRQAAEQENLERLEAMARNKVSVAGAAEQSLL